MHQTVLDETDVNTDQTTDQKFSVSENESDSSVVVAAESTHTTTTSVSSTRGMTPYLSLQLSFLSALQNDDMDQAWSISDRMLEMFPGHPAAEEFQCIMRARGGPERRNPQDAITEGDAEDEDVDSDGSEGTSSISDSLEASSSSDDATDMVGADTDVEEEQQRDACGSGAFAAARILRSGKQQRPVDAELVSEMEKRGILRRPTKNTTHVEGVSNEIKSKTARRPY